ncbi:MAG: glycoside hydrolase family 10 protein [Bacilli bacterium]
MRKCKFILMVFLLGLISLFLFRPQVTATTNYQENIFEFRGAWVATVSNIDISRQASTQAMDIKAYQDEFLQIINVFEAYKLNAVIFQVRPTNDAFYSSTINPWSRFLINVEGRYPGWDPMEWMIEQCHARNMEFHAWLNPYRASLGVLPDTGDYQTEMNAYLQTLDPINFARLHPDLLVRGIHTTGDARILLNPAEPLVREHIYDTIEEIVRKYDVDAIHFDDYFYNGVADVEDNDNYQTYLQTNPYMTKGDWRREQVNILIEGISNLLDGLNTTLNKQVQFGISPAGVWAPADNMGCGAYGQPGGMTDIACYSYSSYVDLFADTKKWVNEEWVDYIVPQNYGNLEGNHPAITRWWANEVSKGDVKLYIGLAPYQYRTTNQGWDIPEMDNQMMLGYTYPTVSGYVFFSIKELRNPANLNMTEAFNKLKERWSHRALTPIIFKQNVTSYPSPELTTWRNTNHINLYFGANPSAYGYVIYRLPSQEVFDADNTPVYDVVINSDEAFFVRHEAENLVDYTYYVQTVYNDGVLGTYFKPITTGVFDTNVAPVLSNVKIEAESLVFAYRDWVTVTGEVSDANDDELEVTLDFTIPNYSMVYEAEIIDGKFSFSVFIPPYSVNRGRFTITAFDGIESDVEYTTAFYAPSSKYTDTMIQYMNMELVLANIIEQIYGG